MTARKDFKRTIRKRMRRTGESYTAARRHFLGSKDSPMTKQTIRDETILRLPIDRLSLTLKTARILKGKGIERIGELVERTASGTDDLGLGLKGSTEVRDVLASRGL